MATTIGKPEVMHVDDVSIKRGGGVLGKVSAQHEKLDYSGAHEKTDPKEIALVKKLDRWIMPMLWSMFWLNYLDRNAIALARLNNLEKDPNLSSTGHVTRPSRYLGTVMMVWAVVSAFTALCKDFIGLLLARFFLVLTEAPYYPGLIAAGVFHGMDGTLGLADWKWLFILQGSVNFVVAIVGFFLLPDFPLTKWLTEEERQLAHSRIEQDTFPTVVETLGLGQTATLVLTCPPYLIAGVAIVLVSWSSGRFNERTWHITASKAVATIGFVAAACTLNLAGRYISMVIFTAGTYGVNSLILGWCGSVCGQTKEKKAVSISIVTTIMNISFIWTPYLWPESDEPRYAIAMGSSAGFSIATALLAWLAKIILIRRNNKLRPADDETTTFYVY
ncbi:MFS transporter prlL [Paramyrothecium foliicola]|nr:MFS transporter prlL [Paramyrothecium foliicola]